MSGVEFEVVRGKLLAWDSCKVERGSSWCSQCGDNIGELPLKNLSNRSGSSSGVATGRGGFR